MKTKMIYEQPKLIVYGTVENLTQIAGSGIADFVLGPDSISIGIGSDPNTSQFSF